MSKIRIRRSEGGDWQEVDFLAFESGWVVVEVDGSPIRILEEHCHTDDLVKIILELRGESESSGTGVTHRAR